MAYGAQAEAAHDDHPHGWRRVYSNNHKAAVYRHRSASKIAAPGRNHIPSSASL
jgi:hypothetical protein